MSTTINDVQAAPPDDGGTQGSFTVPSDALQTRNDPSDRSPSLHQDAAINDRPMRKQHLGLPIVIGLLLLFVIAALVFGASKP